MTPSREHSSHCGTRTPGNISPLHPFFNTHACSRQLRWPTAKTSNQGAIRAHDEIARQWFERPPATVIGSDNQSDICALLTVPKRLNLELVGFAIFADTFVSIFSIKAASSEYESA